MKQQWGCKCTNGRGKNHQAYLWQYSKPGGAVVFTFRVGREREGPKRFLVNSEGILQSEALRPMSVENKSLCRVVAAIGIVAR
jgi:hypothetical protein